PAGSGSRFATVWRRLTTGSPRAADGDPAHPPRAGDVDAFVWWNWIQFDTTDASKLLSDVLSLRDRVTTFLAGELPRDKDARDIALRRVYEVARDLIAAIDREELIQESAGGYQRSSQDFEATLAGLRARLVEAQT